MARDADEHAILPPAGVLETTLYAPDLDAERRFFTGVFGLEVVSDEPERHVFFRCGTGMLLVFNPASTERDQVLIAGSPIPRHGARGPGHMAFLVDDSAIDAWRDRFIAHGIEIESEIAWPDGGGKGARGRSIYVRDPAGNSVEVATPGLWGLPTPDDH